MLSHHILRIASITSVLLVTGCGGGANPGPYTYRDITISVTPQVASIPVGASLTFNSIVTNAPNAPSWYIPGSFGGGLGTLTPLSPGSVQYTAPATPPIYLAIGQPSEDQGKVTLFTDVPGGPSTRQTFAITAPSVTVGLFPQTADVALDAKAQITGYAVGDVNNAVLWQVNGVTGGSVATGTVNARGLYTAPSFLPMSGDKVTVTVISQADPTKSASAVITLH